MASLFDHIPRLPRLKLLFGNNEASEVTPEVNKNSLSRDAKPIVASAMSALYASAINNRNEHNRQYEKVKGYYIVDALLSNISEDVLVPDITSGEVLRVTSPNNIINAELESFQRNVDLDNLVTEIVYDLLEQGEYSLRLITKEKAGLVDIIDDVKQDSLIAFYKQGYPIKFLISNKETVELHPPSRYAHFILSSRKIRVPVFAGVDKKRLEVVSEELRQLPSHARIGRPILFGVLSKIKELQLLEQLVPAIKLSQIQGGSIVSIEVPPSTSPKDAFTISREYENLFNKKIAINQESGDISAADILTTAGRIKVIPTFGGKGGLQNVDVKSDSNTSDITSSVTDLRNVICTSIGYPPELLFGGAGKLESIKKYARYLRKVKSIQQCIIGGITQICLAHLVNKDGMPPVTAKDIQVEFKNETVNIDELEKLEYFDASMSYVNNVVSTVNNILAAPELAGSIDTNRFKNWLSNHVEFIDYAGLKNNSPDSQYYKKPSSDNKSKPVPEEPDDVQDISR